MQNKFGIMLAVVLGLAIITATLFAHHGSAIYDNGKAVTMKGVVTDWLWANPHCLLEFDVKDENGKTVHWVRNDGLRGKALIVG